MALAPIDYLSLLNPKPARDPRLAIDDKDENIFQAQPYAGHGLGWLQATQQQSGNPMELPEAGPPATIESGIFNNSVLGQVDGADPVITTGTSAGAPPTNNLGGLEELFNLENMPQIPGINLGEMPRMDWNFQPGFTGGYFNMAENVRGRIRDFWNETPSVVAEAAQHNLGGVPQPGAQQVGSNAGLQHLLSGQGFDPATMAKIRGSITDTNAQAGASRLGQARRAIQNAGLGNSGAAVSTAATISGQNQDALTRSLNEADIQNSIQGLENLRMGAGMELQRGTSNAQQANAMALANASNMLTAMSQNVANMQQRNMTNANNEQARRMQSASDQSNFFSQAGQNYNTASTAQAIGANEQNNANAINWRLNQAGLDRERDRFNVGIGENRWGTGVNALLGLAGMQNPAAYTSAANTLTAGQQPTNFIGATVGNTGRSILDSLIRGRYNPGGG